MNDEYLQGIENRDKKPINGRSSLVDFSAARWDKHSNPSAHSPRDALVAALRDLDAGIIKADHLIVVYARERDQSVNMTYATGWYQGGKLDGYYGAMGLLHEAIAGISKPVQIKQKQE